MNENLKEHFETQALAAKEALEQEDAVLSKQEVRLIQIASWADSLSKVFVGFAVILSTIRLINAVRIYDFYGRADIWSLLINITNELDALVLVAIVFILMQAVSQGIYLLMDIQDSIDELKTLERDEEIIDE